MMPRITLQNTPDRKGAIARSACFDGHGNILAGTLHLPEAPPPHRSPLSS